MPINADRAPVRLADYRPPDHLIDTVDLDVRLSATATRVVSRLAIRPNPLGRPGAPLVLDGDGLDARRVELDGVALDLAAVFAGPNGMTIEAPPARPFELLVETIVNPAANTHLSGLYRSGSAYCTQCEAEGFRRITYFIDRPDVLSVYTTRLEAEKAEAPILLCNGNPGESGDIAGTTRHYAVWHDPHPKPCYLFALVGGDLGALRGDFVTASGRNVKLAIYVERGKQDSAAYAMDALKRAMRWDERAFGREYDLDVFNIVAVPDFNMGAMENKGLSIFNDKYILASPRAATDFDYAGIETVVAHEYFHNWTGNRVTCRDWFQLCLKEGLTVFRDEEFTADERSRPVKRISNVRALRARQFPEDAGPLAHNVRPEAYFEINNFYTSTIYEKGAEVIRALKTLIGAAAFRAGMDLYFERCDGTAATVEDFIACFAETSGRDLEPFMRWYTQAGTPVLTARGAYDAAARTYALELSQSTPPTPGQPEKQPLVMPVALGLVGPNGGDTPLRAAGEGEPDGASAAELATGVFELSQASRRIVFRDVGARPVPSVLRDFSAPVRLECGHSEDDLLTLMRHDSDLFNRWQAAQTYATRLLTRSAASLRAGGGPVVDEKFAAAIGEIIANAERDPAFAALAIALPSEGDMAREIGANVDPQAVFQAIKGLKSAIGAAVLPQALKAGSDLSSDGGPFSPDAAAAGRRALRNALLELVACGDASLGGGLAERQFEHADNMTDQIGALSVLVNIPGEARERALELFHRAHAADPLIVDKWFALQAAIPEPETLARVRALMSHRAFSLLNPNRMRALVGTFASVNQTQFNAADGSGYEFVADIAAELDPRNPQVAARLLGAFRSWKVMEPGRRARAQAALRRLSSIAALSTDSREIVERCLA